MAPVHTQVLDAARGLAGTTWTFAVADVIRKLPHLNCATVRTHVASRCCVNAPANHHSRYRYFRAVDRGIYRIEAPFRRRPAQDRRQAASQDVILATLDSGVDSTLLTASLAMTPTERIETMRRAAMSLEAIRRP